MTSRTVRFALLAFALAAALAASPAIYAQARTKGASGGWMSRMMGGCGGMMGSGTTRGGATDGGRRGGGTTGGGMVGGGMMGGGTMGGGTMGGGGERPNQQWRR